jgi:hypothetical protein
LPAAPFGKYPNFPGFPIFLGKKPLTAVKQKKHRIRRKETTYATWQEASAAVRKLRITSGDAYHRDAYLKDERLPYHPDRRYADFPGWSVFLSK